MEGWSVTEPLDGRFVTLRQGLRESPKAWIACFLMVIAVGALLVTSTSRHEKLTKVRLAEPPHRETGPYLDKKHYDFIDEYRRQFSEQGIELEARFINAGVFQVVAPAGLTRDELIQVSRWAANGVYLSFRNAPVVNVYVRDKRVPPTLKLATVTQWASHRSDFDVTFQPGSVSSAGTEDSTYGETVPE